MIRLGVNVDHVATLRQARGTPYPDPVFFAKIAEEAGADNITCHLREDRRHIQDRDLFLIKDTIGIPLNFEMATTQEMVQMAVKIQPHAVTLVPEKRQELTTEGGLDLTQTDRSELAQKISSLKTANILVSLFIDFHRDQIILAKEMGVDAVEFHTGNFCEQFPHFRKSSEIKNYLAPLADLCAYTASLGLQVHAGHGLNYQNAPWMQCLPHLEEVNIGHAIIARALYSGMGNAVKDMKRLVSDPTFKPC